MPWAGIGRDRGAGNPGHPIPASDGSGSPGPNSPAAIAPHRRSAIWNHGGTGPGSTGASLQGMSDCRIVMTILSSASSTLLMSTVYSMVNG